MTSQAILVQDGLEDAGDQPVLKVVGGPDVDPSPGQARIERLIERSRNGQRPATRRLRLVSRQGKPVVQPVGDIEPPIAQPAWDPGEAPDDTGRVQQWLEKGQPPEDIGFRALAAATRVRKGATPTVETIEKLATRLPDVMAEALEQLEGANQKRTQDFLSRATREFDGRLEVLERTLDRLSEHVDKATARHAELVHEPVHVAPPALEIGVLRTEMTLKLLTLLFAGAALFSMAVIVRGLLG